jgi:transcriptional regulator with XRE-family HTH domain
MEWDEAVWTANAVGELIAAAPGMETEPTKDMIPRAISALADRFSGYVARLAHSVGVNKATMRDWLREEKTPEIGRILRICFRLNMSPLQFLLSHSIRRDPPAASLDAEKSGLQGLRRNPGRPVDFEEFRNAIRVALAEHPPPTLKEVARRLNRRPALLLARFPRQYAILVRRYARYQRALLRARWDRLRPSVQAALTEEPPPAPEALARRIGCSISALKKYYPRFYRVLKMRYSNHRKNRVLSLRPRLEAALSSSDPPVLFATLARSCGYTKGTLRRHFPELARLLIQERLDYKNAIRLARWQRIEAEIRQVALRLHNSGIYPSLRRVADCFKYDSIRLR